MNILQVTELYAFQRWYILGSVNYISVKKKERGKQDSFVRLSRERGWSFSFIGRSTGRSSVGGGGGRAAGVPRGELPKAASCVPPDV